MVIVVLDFFLIFEKAIVVHKQLIGTLKSINQLIKLTMQPLDSAVPDIISSAVKYKHLSPAPHVFNCDQLPRTQHCKFALIKCINII